MQRLRSLFNIKVILGGVVVTVCLIAVLLLFLFNARNEQPATASSTAVLYVIGAPSATPLAPFASATPSPTPTQSVPNSPTNGILAFGAYVQITGTGGDGLRLRSDPGLSGTIRFLAIDGEVFQVLDGPQTADGYTWWFLQAPYDTNVEGWAVADFLVVVQNP
jgi:hypothetical protein